jgi:hypothetical protein
MNSIAMPPARSLSTEEIKTLCQKALDSAPHRNVLSDDDMRTWIRAVVGSHGEAAIWHAQRACGFGGSEIGVLVRNHLGHRADHQNSAHDILASKLLKSVPQEDAGDLRRGHENEPLHAQRFYAKHGAVRDQVAFNLLSKATGLRPWMRYSPDDVVVIPTADANPRLNGKKLRRLLIDYKAPRNVDSNEFIAFQYSCQLHQGAMICAAQGIHLDGLMLSQYDWAGWRLKDDYVAYDPELAMLILEAGDHYHSFLMRGLVPSYIVTPRFDQSEAYEQRYSPYAQRYAYLAAIESAASEEKEKAAQVLKQGLEGKRLAGTRIIMDCLSIAAANVINSEAIRKLLPTDDIAALRKSGPVEYDQDALANAFKELGGNPTDFRVKKLDPEKTFAHLVAQGYDPEALMHEQIRMRISPQIKSEAQAMIAQAFPEITTDALTTDLSHSASDPIVRDGLLAECHAQRASFI